MNLENRMNTNKSTGYLEIFIGPMYSGKTSKLLEIYKQYKFCNVPIEVINYSDDTRYHDTMLSSHDEIMIPCIQTLKMSDVMNEERIQKADVILINEGQFFEDLVPVVLELVQLKKKVYVSGLDSDFERKKFGTLLDLIPMCNKVTKIHSLCSLCKDGTAGIFSLRLTQEKEQKVIGSECYIPVCRYCYENSKTPCF
jgi:thymidine kinase